MRLFSQKNPKIEKSNRYSDSYLTKILHLAPALSSGHQMCASASTGCIAACLNTSGHGRYQRVQNVRINRTKLFVENRKDFQNQLYREIENHRKYAAKHGKIAAVRLNGTSDIVWEKVFPDMFVRFSDVIFYDYTKHIKRCLPNYKLPPNYKLCFSRSESNEDHVHRLIESGSNINVAVVFDNRPKKYMGRKVVDGDKHDLRFLDGNGVIVGLSPKGRGKHDRSGFVVRG